MIIEVLWLYRAWTVVLMLLSLGSSKKVLDQVDQCDYWSTSSLRRVQGLSLHQGLIMQLEAGLGHCPMQLDHPNTRIGSSLGQHCWYAHSQFSDGPLLFSSLSTTAFNSRPFGQGKFWQVVIRIRNKTCAARCRGSFCYVKATEGSISPMWFCDNKA